MKHPVFDISNNPTLLEDFEFQNRGIHPRPDGTFEFIIYAWKREEILANHPEYNREWFMTKYCPFNEGDFIKLRLKGSMVKGQIERIVRDYYDGHCLELFVIAKGVQAKKVASLLKK